MNLQFWRWPARNRELHTQIDTLRGERAHLTERVQSEWTKSTKLLAETREALARMTERVQHAELAEGIATKSYSKTLGELAKMTQRAEQEAEAAQTARAQLQAQTEHNEQLWQRLQPLLGLEELVRRVQAVSEPQVLAALAIASDENALWQAIHTLLARQKELETENALRPGLEDGAAQYNRGRAAALLDFQAGLLAKRQQCQRME